MLSISQLKTLFKCPMLWYNKYFFKFKPDYEEDMKYFKIGKAFHSLLEGVPEDEALKEFTDKQDRLLIKGMYIKASDDFDGVNFIDKEKFFTAEFDGFKFVGYIDAIIEKDNEKMIAEFKTCSSFTPEERLKYDLQILFYTNYSSDTGKIFYHQTKKPSIKIKKNEDENEFLYRVIESCETLTTIVDNKDTKEECFEQLSWCVGVLKNVLKCKEKPKPIFLNHACTSFGKKCPYFELCFGKRRDELNVALNKYKDGQEVLFETATNTNIENTVDFDEDF